MGTSREYVEFVCGCAGEDVPLRYRKMFGEYLVYLRDRPALLVCDNTVYVKRRPELAEELGDAPIGRPYEGAQEHYLLDIEDRELVRRVLAVLETLPAAPKRKRRG